MIIDFNNIDIFDDFVYMRTKTGSHEFCMAGDSSHDPDGTVCNGSYKVLGLYPIGEFNQMRVLFKCSTCKTIFEDLYNYTGFETYEEIGLENQFKEAVQEC